MNLLQFNPRSLVDLGLANGWLKMPCHHYRGDVYDEARRERNLAKGLTARGKPRKRNQIKS